MLKKRYPDGGLVLVAVLDSGGEVVGLDDVGGHEFVDRVVDSLVVCH